MVVTIAIALASLAFFWLPFLAKTDSFWGIDFGRRGMEVVIQNFDGLNFLVVAKSLYNPQIIETMNKQFLTSDNPLYFTAHYPGFPLVIRAFDTIMPGTYALLSAIIFSNIMLALGFYLFFRAVTENNRAAGWLTTLALFLPPRMLSDRVVGSNEPLFISLVLLSLTLAYAKKHWLASILGSLAILTRSPGILLFVAYMLANLIRNRKDWREIIKTAIPYSLMPLTLIGIWAFYGYQYGDPLAYFKSGVSLNLHVPPFLAFGSNQEWVTGMWRDDIFYIYLIFGVGLTIFAKKYFPAGLFGTLAVTSYGVIYLAALFFVAHRDIARYSLPLAPIVIAGFGEYLLDKRLRWLLILLLIPAYLLGWQFVLQNTQAINDWTVLL